MYVFFFSNIIMLQKRFFLVFFCLIAFFINFVGFFEPFSAQAASIEEKPWISSEMNNWDPQIGDKFLVDVSINMGYLVHHDGSYFAFPLVTGVRRYVWYIGRYYFAATPIQTWEVQSIDIKWDRVTFGKTGRFLRLYFEGERTPYGIHGYNPEDWMFREGERYRSMGCIIVREEILDIIEKTYHLNGDKLSVETSEGVILSEHSAPLK